MAGASRKSIVRLIAKRVIGKVKRYYLYFDGNSYIKSESEIRLIGEKYIRFKLFIPVLRDFIRPYGKVVNGNTLSRMYIDSDGIVSISYDNSSPTVSTESSIERNVLYNVEVYAGANGRYVKFNDEIIHSSLTPSDSDCVIGTFGCNYSEESITQPCYMWDFELTDSYKKIKIPMNKNEIPELLFANDGGFVLRGYNFQESSFVRSVPNA